MKIKGTVALPVYNSAGILWLCLESLCRQVKPRGDWELVVFEELHLTMAGEDYIKSYEDRLREVGCRKITYLTQEQRLPLSQKWVLIAQAADPDSEYYCLCAADNYYQPFMLVDSERYIKNDKWTAVTKGYFYDFNLDKVVLYDVNLRVGLQMTAYTRCMRDLPMDVRYSGVDSWVVSNFGHVGSIDNIDGHWDRILCTNGMNNISNKRHILIGEEKKPFGYTDKRLEDIVPPDIAKSLKELSKQCQLSSSYPKEEETIFSLHEKKNTSLFIKIDDGND